MGTEWSWDDDQGCWQRPVGDGSVTVDIYPDELVGFPPLVEVRAERDRLLAAIKAHKEAMLGDDPVFDGALHDEDLWSVLNDVGGDR